MFLSSCASLNQQKPTLASEYAGLRKTTFNDGTILSYASDAGDLQAREGNLSDSYYNGKQNDPRRFRSSFLQF